MHGRKLSFNVELEKRSDYFAAQHVRGTAVGVVENAR